MLLKLVDNTPNVYTEESRDFQLFLRAYDSVLNGVINDVDLMQKLTSSKDIKTELLPLLQTKLGFKSKFTISSQMLRGILCGFPELLKNKGSITGVQQAINIFLKVLGIKTDLVIAYTEAGTIALGREVNDHTIVIGINEALTNYYVLLELLKYVLPAGFGFSIYFYRGYDRYTWLETVNSAKIIFVGDSYAGSIRSDIYDSSKTYEKGDIAIYGRYAWVWINDKSGNETPPDDPQTTSDYWQYNAEVNSIINAINLNVVQDLSDDYIADTNEHHIINVQDENILNEPVLVEIADKPGYSEDDDE